MLRSIACLEGGTKNSRLKPNPSKARDSRKVKRQRKRQMQAEARKIHVRQQKLRDKQDNILILDGDIEIIELLIKHKIYI